MMFWIAALVAVAATAMAITRPVVVHALIYAVVSLLASAVAFALLGATFAAALEVIVYAGAIMVLFVFVVMLLGDADGPVRSQALRPKAWIGPGILCAILGVELIVAIAQGTPLGAATAVGPKAVATALYGPYALGVEIASMLLLAGIVAAYHVGREERR